ncbi:MAG TPA: aminotransferase class I/II-fold pyridoxal phosphate-dependent enzyme [Gemmatimonadaceae bacterium]
MTMTSNVVGSERPLHSEYLEWAKAQLPVRYPLSVSGVPPLQIETLDPSLEDFTMVARNEYGWPPLVERIAKRYSVEPSCVVLAPGTTMANFIACSALIEPGDEVLLEHPTYDPLRAVAEYLHASVRLFARRPENAYHLDVAAIEEAMTHNTRLIMISNLHNPTGALDSRTDLEELAALAEARDIYVLVDEVYLDWVYGGIETPPSATDISPRFVSTNSLTKVFGLAALRAGWILAEPEVADRMKRLSGLFMNYMPHPTERIAARALDRAEEILRVQRERVDANRALVASFVETQNRLQWVRPVAGTTGFVRLDGEDVDAFIAKARADYEVSLVPGRFFGEKEYFRIGFGMETATVAGGLERLAELLRST